MGLPVPELEAELVAASAAAADPVRRVDALTSLAWALRRGEVARANALASEARSLALQHGYKLGQARAARTMAMTIRDSDSLKSMFGLAEEARRLFDEVEDAHGRAASRDFLSSLYEYVGDLTGGMELALDALSIARELGDPTRQGYALSSVGGILARSGEVDAAVERLKEALQLFEGAQDARGVTTICSRLSRVLVDAGRLDEAMTYAELCRSAAEKTQDVVAHAVSLTVMAELEAKAGRADEAERLYRTGLTLLEPLDAAGNVMGAEPQIALGQFLVEQGRLTDADAELTGALARVEGDTISIVTEAAAHEALAELRELQGQLAPSIQHLRTARRLREQIAQREAKNKLALVELRAEMEAAREDAEVHRLRFVELRGQRSVQGVPMDQRPQLGPYRLIEPMARGGMGEVWRARHRMLKRDAAIKVIRRDVLESGAAGDAALRRFEREARATSALKSPHTVEIHDFGITEDGTFYYVMELLDGLGLDTLVERYGPLTWKRVVYVLAQVCESLAEAHRSGLIHRDIKPGNILLCRHGLKRDVVKVVDFGLVKRTSGADPSDLNLTGTAVVGTPAFMPPEVAQPGGALDARSDLYALGCVGYWLLTGKLVYEADTPLQMVLAHVQGTVPRPSAHTEMQIPADLDDVVMACLCKDPAARPQSAEALSALLHACVVEEPWTEARAADWWRSHAPSTQGSRPAPPEANDDEDGFSLSTPATEGAPPRSRWYALGLLVIAGVVAWMLWFATAGPAP